MPVGFVKRRAFGEEFIETPDHVVRRNLFSIRPFRGLVQIERDPAVVGGAFDGFGEKAVHGKRFVIRLFHQWNRETGAVTPAVRDDIIDVAKTMVKLEEGFVDLAFGLGKIEGMTPGDIKSYVRYVADWRLTQLKLAPVFGYFTETASGYEQIDILNGVEHANFFEQRATEYSKGASRGNWDGAEGVWTMFDKRNAAKKDELTH